eukprot:TRINITY_DN8696_c0_g1_i2.p1 TRINITY_DN8696_c0_g1~~TRINITY_DN8696_c0_g1_i2.p1  ORF type:complete len:413 (+),score=35.99 TRINITY_DN8696_c0_g1_i2:106-1344(+)
MAFPIKWFLAFQWYAWLTLLFLRVFSIITQKNALTGGFLVLLAALAGLAFDAVAAIQTSRPSESLRKEIAQLPERHKLTPKQALSLPADHEIVKQTVQGVRLLPCLLLFMRIVMNLTAIGYACVDIFAPEVELTFYNLMAVTEASIAVGMLVKVGGLCTLGLEGFTPRLWSFTCAMRSLAGFSALRVLAYLSMRGIIQTWNGCIRWTTLPTKRCRSCQRLCGSLLFCILMCTYLVLGVCVTFEKLKTLKLDLLAEAGVREAAEKLANYAMDGDYESLAAIGIWEFAALANQWLSITDVDAMLVERLSILLFAGGRLDFQAKTGQKELARQYLEGIALFIDSPSPSRTTPTPRLLSGNPSTSRLFWSSSASSERRRSCTSSTVLRKRQGVKIHRPGHQSSTRGPSWILSRGLQ